MSIPTAGDPSQPVTGQRDEHQREDEADAICERILEGIDADDAKSRDFLTYRFKLPLIWYGDHAPKQRRWYTMTALAVITAGLLSSALTAVAKGQSAFFGEFVGWIVIGLGLAVGLGTGITQVMRPSQKSVAYAHAQAAMRREGWDLVGRRGRYEGKDDKAAFGAFMDTVLDLEAQTVAVDTEQEKAAGSS